MTGRLAGRVVATTREADADDPLVRLLEREGADVRVWPTLAFLPPENPEPLHWALEHLEAFHWLAFTSPRAALAVTPLQVWYEGFGRVAAVGEKTARTLKEGGWPVHLVSQGAGAAGLVRAMGAESDLVGAWILFLAGSMARETLEEELEKVGAKVRRVEAYRTVISPPDPGTVRVGLAHDGVAAVLFASPSAVDGLGQSLDGDLGRALEDAGAVAVAIGPTTADALYGAGVERVAVAERTSMEGLVEACVQALNRN